MGLSLRRRRLWGAGSIPPLPNSNELACLGEIRLEIAASYPRVRVTRIAKILRKFGQKRLPAGLLIDSPSRLGGLGMLLRAQIPRLARGIDWHPLFSSAAYLALNPDVASARETPWLHYQVFGRVEGRSPHPFVDIRLMSASMPGVPVGEVLDQYLALPELWTLDTSPYVDCQRFLLSGQWDGRTNPLVQLVTRSLQGPWIHHRLMLVDTAVDNAVNARTLAVATLIAKNGPSARMNEVALWYRPEFPQLTGAEGSEYTVIPGFFLGSAGIVLASAPGQIMSADSSMIQVTAEYVSLVVGSVLHAEELLYLEGPLSREQLRELLQSTAPGDVVVAPGSAVQQRVAEQILREAGTSRMRVLEFGRQVRVVSSRMRIVPATELETPAPEWAGITGDGALGVAFVVGEHDLARALENAEVRAAVDSGAVICAVSSGDVAAWAPLLHTRSVIVAVDELTGSLRGVVDDGSIRVLSRTIFGGGS